LASSGTPRLRSSLRPGGYPISPSITSGSSGDEGRQRHTRQGWKIRTKSPRISFTPVVKRGNVVNWVRVKSCSPCAALRPPALRPLLLDRVQSRHVAPSVPHCDPLTHNRLEPPHPSLRGANRVQVQPLPGPRFALGEPGRRCPDARDDRAAKVA